MCNKITGQVIFFVLDVLGLLLHYCIIVHMMFLLLNDVRLSYLIKDYLRTYLLTNIMTWVRSIWSNKTQVNR